MNTLHAVIDAINAATDNDSLEQLGREFLDIDIDKRKKAASNRSHLLRQAQARLADASPEHARNTATPGDPDSLDKPANPGTPPTPRLLKHRSNGRLFIWTPMLASAPDLSEV